MDERCFMSTITHVKNVSGVNKISTTKDFHTSQYLHPYLLMKSQRMVLDSLEPRLLSPPKGISWENQQKFDYLAFLVQSLKSTNFASLFKAADSTIAAVRNMLADQDIPPEIERMCNSLMNVSVTLQKVANGLCVSYSLAPQASKLIDQPPSSFYLDDSDVEEDEELVVCRICEQSVPISRLEEHSNSCIAAYTNENRIKQINETIREQQAIISTTYLEKPWPGVRTEALSTLFPLLHSCLLLERAFKLDPQISDTIDELNFIFSCLSTFPITKDNAVIMKNAKDIVQEKIRTSNALSEATLRLRPTLANGINRLEVQTTTIAEFDFIKRISRGAFASVFLAKKKKTGDIFAIKVTPKDSLKQKNQHVGALDEPAAKLYASQIVYALKYLRQNGIIHRDLKPDNILVGKDGHLKLTDFGLSFMGMVDRHITAAQVSDEDIKEASSFVGTPDYISPEIIRNQPHSFTTDYWSLGIIIYEFLYGEPPFHGANESQTHLNILLGHIDFSGVEVSDEAQDLIKKLLQIEPENRLGASDVEDILNHPWFAGVDPINDPPPFKPELESESDTNYFEQRYDFETDSDATIIDDIARALRPSRLDFAADSDISSFPSISITQLGNANLELASRFEHKRSGSISYDSSDPLAECAETSKLKVSASFSKVDFAQQNIEPVAKKRKKHSLLLSRTRSTTVIGSSENNSIPSENSSSINDLL